MVVYNLAARSTEYEIEYGPFGIVYMVPKKTAAEKEAADQECDLRMLEDYEARIAAGSRDWLNVKGAAECRARIAARLALLG